MGSEEYQFGKEIKNITNNLFRVVLPERVVKIIFDFYKPEISKRLSSTKELYESEVNYIGMLERVDVFYAQKIECRDIKLNNPKLDKLLRNLLQQIQVLHRLHNLVLPDLRELINKWEDNDSLVGGFLYDEYYLF
eukprot:UN28914